MYQVKLPDEMSTRLTSIARHDGMSVDQMALSALELFIQDREDSIDADEIMGRDEPLAPWLR